VAGSDGQYGLQHGQQLTGQTRMETMGNLMVSFHGGGKLKKDTSDPDLPYAHIFPNHCILTPHQVGTSLPQPGAPLGMEPRLPCGLSPPQEAPQEEESKTTKQD
jgi:hypothetical protein